MGTSGPGARLQAPGSSSPSQPVGGGRAAGRRGGRGRRGANCNLHRIHHVRCAHPGALGHPAHPAFPALAVQARAPSYPSPRLWLQLRDSTCAAHAQPAAPPRSSALRRRPGSPSLASMAGGWGPHVGGVRRWLRSSGQAVRSLNCAPSAVGHGSDVCVDVRLVHACAPDGRPVCCTWPRCTLCTGVL